MERFYGEKTARIRDTFGRSPADYFELLLKIWSADTCAPRMRSDWKPENPTLGQCSVTAFLMQDRFGGEVKGITLEDGSIHCFNIVDGAVFDLTSAQFGDRALAYGEAKEQSRDVHFAKEEKRLRYESLRKALAEALGTGEC